MSIERLRTATLGGGYFGRKIETVVRCSQGVEIVTVVGW